MPRLPVEISDRLRTAKRLLAMSRQEITYRVRQRAQSELERLRWTPIDRALAAGSNFKAYLAGEPARRFYPGPRALRDFASRQFPEWIERAVDEASKLCRHEVELLGYGTVQLGSEIDWHRDPVTGQLWERRFWADYRLENDPAARDPKIIHELNRHQHLPRLAKAYHWTGDERYASEAVAQLECWIDQNPPGWGINWHSSLELGIRVISWLWTIFFLLPSRALTEAAAERIGDSLFAQVSHIARHLSLYSSPNTHLIGESVALYLCGVVFCDRPHSKRWLEASIQLLEGQFANLVLEDGVYAELSSYYHCYALDFYLQAMVLAEQNGLRLAPWIRRGVERMLEFLMHVTRPDGTIPLLGDDDGGRALALQQQNYRSYNDALCLGSILFSRGDFKRQAHEFFEETLWLAGEESWGIFDGLPSELPAPDEHLCPLAGYLIQRSGWEPEDSHLIFDGGGLGILNGGHAHADALSFTFFANGLELLTDPGTFVYNCAPHWRNSFRSTSAHTTVMIDGEDQAETGRTFGWKTKFFSRIVRRRGQGIEYIEGEHDGYTRLPEGLVHRRRLLRVPGNYWIVLDDFSGSGKHTFEFRYQLGPEIQDAVLNQATDMAVACSARGDLTLGILTDGPLQAQLVPGWVSRRYGERVRCSVLRVLARSCAPFAGMTILAPVNAACVIERLRVNAGNGIAMSFRTSSYVDIAVLSTGRSRILVDDLELDGDFFWLRTAQGAILNAVAIGARHFEYKGRNLASETYVRNLWHRKLRV